MQHALQLHRVQGKEQLLREVRLSLHLRLAFLSGLLPLILTLVVTAVFSS